MASGPRRRAVLFDVYNTLIDIWTDEHDRHVWQALARVLRYQGLAADAGTLHTAFFADVRAMLRESPEQHPEVDLRGAFGRLLQALGYTGPDQLSLQLTQLFRALSMHRFRLFPDVLPALQALRPRFKLGIISDAQRAFLEPETQLLGLAPHFDARIVSGDYGFRKPDRRLFQMALTALDVAPTEAVYIGDHPYRDICGAQEAGLQAVLIRRVEGKVVDDRACAPDLVVANLEQFVAWLQRRGA